MLFFKSVDIPSILLLLKEKEESVFGAHLKLYPGITYSHTTNKMISPFPTFEKLNDSILVFDRTKTCLDWNYPFDFCGSIYPLETVVSVIERISDQEKIRKPNTFEFAGNLAIKKEEHLYP